MPRRRVPFRRRKTYGVMSATTVPKSIYRSGMRGSWNKVVGGRLVRRSYKKGRGAWPYSVQLPPRFPKTYLMKSRYAFEFSLNASVLTCDSFLIRANSAYDPEFAAGGHSTYMFDDMMRFYGKYRVVSAKLKVWYIDPAVADQAPFYLTILRSKDGLMHTQFASTDHFLECNVRGNVKICGQFSTANQVALNSSQKATCNMTYSQRKYFPGIKDDKFEAAYNADPASICYFEVTQFPLAGNNPPTAYFRGELQQNILFSEAVLLPESGVNSLGLDQGGTGPIGQLELNYGGTSGLAGFTGAYGGGDPQIKALNS